MNTRQFIETALFLYVDIKIHYLSPFKLNLSNWEYNRDYYIEIKVERDGVIEYFEDKDLTFTVEK